MSDDSGMVDPRQSHEDRYAETLLYDFFKHMTSLALIALGGVLTISQVPDAEIRPFSLGMVVALLSIAGVFGFAGMDEIVKARLAGRDASRRISFYRKVCPAAFAVGVGGFLSIFFRTIY
jgi:hypothetical protein